MKKIIYFLLATISISNSSFGQETEFKFTKEGFTDFVVTQCEGKTQAELYEETLDWVSITYKNPKEVIKAQIENDYIRIEGSSNNLLCKKVLLSTMCDNAKYQIEISFKDGKYKFDIINISGYFSGSQYSSGGWYDVKFDKMSEYYKDNGDVRSMYKNYPASFSETFNSLNISLEDFLKSYKIPSKKSDW